MKFPNLYLIVLLLALNCTNSYAIDQTGPTKLTFKITPPRHKKTLRCDPMRGFKAATKDRRKRAAARFKLYHFKVCILPNLTTKPVKETYQDQDHQPRFVSKYSSKKLAQRKIR